jgi:hypothetical protein
VLHQPLVHPKLVKADQAVLMAAVAQLKQHKWVVYMVVAQVVPAVIKTKQFVQDMMVAVAQFVLYGETEEHFLVHLQGTCNAKIFWKIKRF